MISCGAALSRSTALTFLAPHGSWKAVRDEEWDTMGGREEGGRREGGGREGGGKEEEEGGGGREKRFCVFAFCV